MDGIGKVDGGGAGGQVLHIAVGGEHKHLVGEHIDLQGMNIFLGVRTLLVLQQTADPLVAAFRAAALAVLLVFPVGGDTVLGKLMHLPGADLHLKGNAVRSHDGGVERLIAVGLGRADIILETAQNGLIEVVDNAQHVIAVTHVFHDDTERKQVEDLIQRLVLVEHLAINRIRVLHPAVNDVLDLHLVQADVDLILRALHEVLILLPFGIQLGDDLRIADGVQIF